ncbi:methyltransferase domain-containing protein [Candidatus Parcubacteria bacterium]|nr:MAG: methyltransferase domain-containing protein [Candidatus Parcubacteria bacterium]
MAKLNYFFVLGNHPHLSRLEVEAVLAQSNCRLLSEKILAVASPQTLEEEKLIKRLGGTIKIGRLNAQCKDWQQLKQNLSAALAAWAPPQQKIYFGFSTYGFKNDFNIKSLAMELKKQWRQKGFSVRWVTSRSPELSSVVAEQNKLLTPQGKELVIIKDKKSFWWGETRAVQPFKEWSLLDYGRPCRDDRSGMLPPKLARIMINLARPQTNQTILDPFCGSGTILTEAAQLGNFQLWGSDLSKKAIANSQENLLWLKNKLNLKFKMRLLTADVARLSQYFGTSSVNRIITEPYLGPQRGKIDIKKTTATLNRLYTQALKQFWLLLKPGGRVVMVWPIFYQNGKKYFLSPALGKFQPLKTNPECLIYHRPQQKVWRQIVILDKF